VYTGLEFERLCNAMGPTSGKIVKKNGQAPAWSASFTASARATRTTASTARAWCCMYSLKFAHLLREKTTARVFEFYIDMRAFGKGYEEFYDRVHARRGRASCAGKAGQVLVPSEADADAPEGSMNRGGRGNHAGQALACAVST